MPLLDILLTCAPPVLLISAYFLRKWYLARRLRLHGIGKGAPGFQTNVRQIRVTPEIAARLRRGEQVSPEEIAEASARAEAEQSRSTGVTQNESHSRHRTPTPSPEPTNEWLPETITNKRKRPKGKKQ